MVNTSIVLSWVFINVIAKAASIKPIEGLGPA